MRGFACIAVAVGLALPAGAARGEEKKGAVVAVLPLSTPSKRMAFYGKPVADALAKRLRAQVKTPRLKVEAISTSGAVPTRVDLVVYGRIVRAGKGTVMLEARVHDPERGRRWRMVATRSGALTSIDELAKELASKLAPRLDRAVGEQRRRRAADTAHRKRRVVEARARKPVQLPTTIVRGRHRRNGRLVEKKQPVTDRRARIVVLRAGAARAEHPTIVSDLVTQSGYRLASRIGLRAVASSVRGVVGADELKSEIARTGARWALMIDVRRLQFRWHGKVMSARGRFRVVVVAQGGRVVYDRTAKTGTLVGSRGDRDAALVRFVAEQVVDIVAPHLSRALKAHAK